MRILASMVAAGCLVGAPGIQQPTTGIVAEVRNALGGDGALAAVSSFSMDGRALWLPASGDPMYSMRIDCELPDKIVVTRLRAEGDRSVIERTGINGNALIRETIFSPPFAAPPQPLVPGSPAETAAWKAAERERQVVRGRQWFAALTLLLFARSNPTYPLELGDAGTAEILDTHFRVIEGRGPGPSGIRLFVDPVTHLPSIASWMATRELPGSSALTLMSPSELADALGNSPIEHQLHVGDYKVSNGIKWPRLLIEYMGGREIEELTLRKVTLNARFPPDHFQATK